MYSDSVCMSPRSTMYRNSASQDNKRYSMKNNSTCKIQNQNKITDHFKITKQHKANLLHSSDTSLQELERCIERKNKRETTEVSLINLLTLSEKPSITTDSEICDTDVKKCRKKDEYENRDTYKRRKTDNCIEKLCVLNLLTCDSDNQLEVNPDELDIESNKNDTVLGMKSNEQHADKSNLLELLCISNEIISGVSRIDQCNQNSVPSIASSAGNTENLFITHVSNIDCMKSESINNDINKAEKSPQNLLDLLTVSNESMYSSSNIYKNGKLLGNSISDDKGENFKNIYIKRASEEENNTCLDKNFTLSPVCVNSGSKTKITAIQHYNDNQQFHGLFNSQTSNKTSGNIPNQIINDDKNYMLKRNKTNTKLDSDSVSKTKQLNLLGFLQINGSQTTSENLCCDVGLYERKSVERVETTIHDLSKNVLPYKNSRELEINNKNCTHEHFDIPNSIILLNKMTSSTPSHMSPDILIKEVKQINTNTNTFLTNKTRDINESTISTSFKAKDENEDQVDVKHENKPRLEISGIDLLKERIDIRKPEEILFTNWNCQNLRSDITDTEVFKHEKKSSIDYIEDKNGLQETLPYISEHCKNKEICQEILPLGNRDLFHSSDGVVHNIQNTNNRKRTYWEQKVQMDGHNIDEDILSGDNLIKMLLKKDNHMLSLAQYDSNNLSGSQLLKQDANIKKYQKGATKIYRLKKRKKYLPTREQKDPLKEWLDMLSQNFEEKTKKPESISSVSTRSSYVTYHANLDVLSTESTELTEPQKLLRKGLNKLLRNESLLYSKDVDGSSVHIDKKMIQTKIEDTINTILDDFCNNKLPVFKIRRQCFENCEYINGRICLKRAEDCQLKIISHGHHRSRNKFNLILYILNKVMILLHTDTKLTKREIFYQLKGMIKYQQVTDAAINAVSCLLDVGMWSLNITAQKGLVFGDAKIILSSGETINCNVPGTLIPQDVNEMCEVHSPAYFILVVEKESVFHKLLEEDLPNKLTRPFILITGKGFPDLNTQLFLKKLWMLMSVPVFILTDADPYGVDIMLKYRCGSLANAHVSEFLAIPKAKWLGVFPSEIVSLNISRESLTDRDCKKVKNLLKGPHLKEYPEIKNELNLLLEKGVKAEIEGLIKSDTYLSNIYLPTKIYGNKLI